MTTSLNHQTNIQNQMVDILFRYWFDGLISKSEALQAANLTCVETQLKEKMTSYENQYK